MKFECDSCHAQYMIADEKVGKRGVKVKCKRCSHVIVVRPEGAAVAAVAADDKGEARAARAAETAAARVETAERSKVSPTDVPPTDDLAPSPAAPEPEPEVTGPGRPAPAPVAVQHDDTQLGASDQTDLAAEPPPAPPAPPPPASDRTQVSAPPAPEPAALADLPAPPPAPAIKGESSIGDALDDQLAGAFNSMFDEGRPGLADLSSLSSSPTPEEQRGPTQILDLDAMNALRRATAGSGADRVERDALDSLRRDLGPPADETSGLWGNGGAGAGRSAPLGSNGKPVDDGLDLPEWHVAIDDEDVGPITLEALSEHIASGAVDRQSLVWKTGMSDWLPAGEVPKVKDLFVKAPLPKIAPPPVDATAPRGRSARPSSFDVGSPIDDLPPAPGGSPFDNVPGMGEESDPHWQPHGLTDVYQAANLAEAASSGGLGGGLVGSAGMAARSGGPSTPPSSSSSPEPEWRPSASSALSALVNDEIDRISKGPGLPPADDLAPRPADDAALGGSLPFSSLAGMSLDAGAEVSDPNQPMGQGSPARTSQVPAFTSNPSFPQPAFGGQPAFSPPPAPPAPQRSPMLYVGIAGAAVVFVMLSLLTYKVVFDKPAQQVVVVGPNGLPLQPGVVPVIDPATGQLAMAGQPVPVPPPGQPVPPPVAAPPPTPAPTDAPPPAPAPAPAPTDAPPPPPVAEPPPPPPAPVQLAGAGTTKKPPKPAPSPSPPPPPPAPVSTPKKGCDPILDLDCKPGGGAASEPKEAAKTTLEKSDILGVVKGALPKVKACGQKHGASGTIKMSWTIAKNGKPQNVSVADTKYGGTPVGTCVTQVVQGLKFPAYTGAAPPPVSIPAAALIPSACLPSASPNSNRSASSCGAAPSSTGIGCASTAPTTSAPSCASPRVTSTIPATSPAWNGFAARRSPISPTSMATSCPPSSSPVTRSTSSCLRRRRRGGDVTASSPA
jgi:predicted Zn finger-like uncharacterized protein